MPQSRSDKRKKALAQQSAQLEIMKAVNAKSEGNKLLIPYREGAVAKKQIEVDSIERNIRVLGNRSRRGSSYRYQQRVTKRKESGQKNIGQELEMDLLNELRQVESEHTQSKSRR